MSILFYFDYRTIFSQLYWIMEYKGFYSHWHRIRICILPYTRLHCISPCSSVFYSRRKTFLSRILLCFTQWKTSTTSNYCLFFFFNFSDRFVLKIKQNLILYLAIILFACEISMPQTVIFILWYNVLYS